ncbi:MAG: cbb3-type cytochrome oxidase assembly protein CcoS [Limisphaerales bacterium]|jgi:cbb3-type cytochrome oxidase maturation protein
MGVIVILILASLLVAAGFLLAFIWAVRSGQFEDTTTPSMRVLTEDVRGGSADTRRQNHKPLPSA